MRLVEKILFESRNVPHFNNYKFRVNERDYEVIITGEEGSYYYNRLFKLPIENKWFTIGFKVVGQDYYYDAKDPKAVYKVLGSVLNTAKEFSKQYGVTTFILQPSTEKRNRIYELYLKRLGVKYVNGGGKIAIFL